MAAPWGEWRRAEGGGRRGGVCFPPKYDVQFTCGIDGKGAGFAGSNHLLMSLQTIVYVAYEDDLNCHSLSFF